MALKEVCFAAFNFGPGRAQAGDVIEIRKPQGGIGRKEGHQYVWLLLDESEIPTPTTRDPESQDPVIKHPLQISIDELKTKMPALDLTRLADPRDFYQPFLGTDPESGAHLRNDSPSSLTIIDRSKA